MRLPWFDHHEKHLNVVPGWIKDPGLLSSAPRVQGPGSTTTSGSNTTHLACAEPATTLTSCPLIAFSNVMGSPKVPMPIMESSATKAVTESLKSRDKASSAFCRPSCHGDLSINKARCWANDKIVMLIVQSSAAPSGGGEPVPFTVMQAGCCRRFFLIVL